MSSDMLFWLARMETNMAEEIEASVPSRTILPDSPDWDELTAARVCRVRAKVFTHLATDMVAVEQAEEGGSLQ